MKIAAIDHAAVFALKIKFSAGVSLDLSVSGFIYRPAEPDGGVTTVVIFRIMPSDLLKI